MAVSPVVRDDSSAEFFDGTRSGEFRLLRRRSTGEYLDPKTALTGTAQDDSEWVAASGTGTIVSWSVVHGRPRDSGIVPRTVVGIVELDEGPWWWCQLVDVDPDTELTGLPVRVVFEPSGSAPEHEVVPVFQPIGADGEGRR